MEGDIIQSCITLLILLFTVEVPSVTVTVDNAPASNHSVEYNGTLVLTCSVVSYGETQTLVWSVPKNKPFAREDANDSVSIYNSTITLEQVGIDHRGIYTCSVSNTAGTGSGDVNVTVYGELLIHAHVWRELANHKRLFNPPSQFSRLGI